MEDKTYCVYQIYNKVEGKCYIGSTCNFERRIKEHKKDNTGWHIDFNQHPENYEVIILEANISDTDVKDRELYFINLYNVIDNGYNKNRVGNNMNLETREKISNSKMGENNPMYGKHLTEETKKKISESNTGKQRSEEIRNKISKSRKGIVFSEEHRRKISEASKNISEETRRKMSESHKYIFLGENNPFFKKHHSEETRKRISEASKMRIWVTNGINTIRILKTDLQKYIDLGYQRGRKLKE